MGLNTFQILILQSTLGIIACSVLVRLYFTSALEKFGFKRVLTFLLTIHLFRYVGSTVLVSEIADPNLPRAFAVQIAYGDIISGILAIVAIFWIIRKEENSLLPVWLFNSIGLLDLLNMMVQSTMIGLTGVSYNLGATWFVVTVYVPVLIISHLVIFWMLFKKGALLNNSQKKQN